MIKAWPHAHGMMPGQRKSPPNHSAKNSLPNGERKNVAFLGEEPGHQNSPDPGKRNKDGIGPMEQSEKRAGQERGANGTFGGLEKAIRDERIQSNLLHQTEGHIAKETLGNQEMMEGAVRGSQKEPRNYNEE